MIRRSQRGRRHHWCLLYIVVLGGACEAETEDLPDSGAAIAVRCFIRCGGDFDEAVSCDRVLVPSSIPCGGCRLGAKVTGPPGTRVPIATSLLLVGDGAMVERSIADLGMILEGGDGFDGSALQLDHRGEGALALVMNYLDPVPFSSTPDGLIALGGEDGPRIGLAFAGALGPFGSLQLGFDPPVVAIEGASTATVAIWNRGSWSSLVNGLSVTDAGPLVSVDDFDVRGCSRGECLGSGPLVLCPNDSMDLYVRYQNNDDSAADLILVEPKLRPGGVRTISVLVRARQ